MEISLELWVTDTEGKSKGKGTMLDFCTCLFVLSDFQSLFLSHYDYREDFPQMCFNAAKSWQLGWYDDKSKDVMPQNGAFTGDLSAFVDYKSVVNGGYVIFKVGTKYLVFNKAKGINYETQEFANEVTITDMPFEGDYSDAVASLNGNGQKYTFPYNGGTAVVEMCSMSNNGGIDVAKISIYMDANASSCGSAPTGVGPFPTAPTGPAPTRARPNPTAPPVPAPTPMPAPDPTPMPVAPPTPPPIFPTCSAGQMEVAITIHTDQKPEETTWYFKKQRGETYGSEGPYHEKAHTYIYKYCVKSSDTFEFHLNDSGNDGISSNAYGNGWYTIAIDGETYNSGGKFTVEEVDYVHGPCSREGTERLQFILLTGTKPQDVTWNLKAEGFIDYTGGPWANYAGQSLKYFSHSCLSAEYCYTITVMSSNGNGLNDGNFEINWMGENVAFSTFSNGSAEANSFGNCVGMTDGRKLDFAGVVKPEIYESYGF